MSAFFNRAVRVTFGDAADAVAVADLHTEFEVVHQIGEANTASVAITNLAEATRRFASEGRALPTRVLVEAGYQDNLEQLFLGRVRTVISTRTGPDWITRIDAGDGEAETRAAHVEATFPQGAKVEDVISTLIDATGLGKGDLLARVREKGLGGALSEFARGFTLSGNADAEIKRLLQANGMVATVNDGVYTAFELQRGSSDTGFLLSPHSGLIGSPEIGDKGAVTVRSLLLPSLRPGHQIGLKSAQFDGRYRVQKARHIGKLRGQDWYTELDLKAL